jgi:glycosyltransferase involved in cell wall biosynthesis
MASLLTATVSVVVASHRPEYIVALAESLVAGFSDSEVIVVADYAVEALSEKFPEILWLYIDNISISVKRNTGSRAAHGSFLAFIDDDCVPEPGWISEMLAYFNRCPQAGGVEGRTIIEAAQVAAPISEFKRLERRGFRTNNIIYRKDVFTAAGGFDEQFSVQREDVDLAYTVLSSGCDIGYCESAIVKHRVRHGETWDLLKNCFNRRFDPLLFKKHPGMYRKHVGSPFTPAIGLVLFFHAIVLLSLLVAPAACPICAGADLTAALALSVRRNQEGQNGLAWVVRDWISFVVSPFVLGGALVYGSLKFRKWLVF